MTRRATRAVIAALLTVPASAVLVTGAAPAQAASTIVSPAADTVYTSGTSTIVTADLDPCAATTTLKVVNPQQSNSWVLTSARPSACDNVVGKPTTRRSMSVTPSWTASMPNGRFTITLSGGASATRYFYTSLAPGTPGDLTAKGTGASRVDLTWSYGGDEADLTGFVIADDKGNSFPVTDKTARSFTAYYDNPTPGTYSYAYTVKAHRKSGTGDGTVSGGASNTASAELVTPQPPPPPPSPTPTPTTDPGETPTPGTTPAPGSGGTATPGSGGTSTPGSGATSGTGTKTGGTKAGTPTLTLPSLNPVVATRRNYALSFNKFSPSLGIPKLPPLPATTFSTTATGAGGYQPTLPYDAQDQESEPDTVLTAPLSAVTSLDSAQLAKSLAFALILIAAAAHMRLFLSSHRGE